MTTICLLQADNIEPVSYVVTRWQEDPFAGMAYSYIPVGRSGEIYDSLAAPVANKIFFAGEVDFQKIVIPTV
jgi:monoamine oxidase